MVDHLHHTSPEQVFPWVTDPFSTRYYLVPTSGHVLEIQTLSKDPEQALRELTVWGKGPTCTEQLHSHCKWNRCEKGEWHPCFTGEGLTLLARSRGLFPYLSWGMIKGQWHAKRQEGRSRETRRRSMDGWRWPVWLQCRDQGGPAQTPALTSRVSSPCYKQRGWAEGWWHDLICMLTAVGRPDHHNSQWQETQTSQEAAAVIQRKDYGSSAQTSDDENSYLEGICGQDQASVCAMSCACMNALNSQPQPVGKLFFLTFYRWECRGM